MIATKGNFPLLAESDIVISGGGPAGVAAALAAARRGYRVLLLEQTGFAPERPVLHFEERETPCALLLDIYHARGGRAFEAARMTGRLYAFLAWLMENAHTERPGARRPGEEHVRRACAFIANNFADAITVEDIARSVGVCRSRLHCVFQQAMEISPAQYLARFRIRQACRLLRETDLSVKAVA